MMAKEGHEHREDLIKPGNEDYLSYYVYQGEWKPTKPIGIIGAMNTSPGPAIVFLPSTIGKENHDPRKFKAPAYIIGEKDTRAFFSCGPGPAAYNIRKKTNKGLDICHAPKVGEKLEELSTFTSPGPAVYSRGDSDKFTFRKAPAYTMRPKPEPMKGFVTPTPNAYNLPETLGPGRSPFKKSPAYSMAERLDKTGIHQPNPGPAAYMLPSTNVHKPKAPSFTMRPKEKFTKLGISSPGPASNDIHLVKFHKPATPRFTFGIRHTPFEAFQHFAAEN